MTTMPSILSWQNWGYCIIKFKKDKKNQIKLKGKLKVKGKGHLRLLKQELECYFPYLSNSELPKWKMTRNLFCLTKNILFKDLKKVLLEMKYSSTAKNNVEAISLTDFWAKYVYIYKSVAAVAIHKLLLLSSSYMCKKGFSSKI